MSAKASALDKSSIISIVALLLLVIFVFAFGVRAIVKTSRGLPLLNLEDCFLISATIFGSIQTILTVVRASNGFGRPARTVPESKLQTILQMEVASDVFYVCAISLAKFAQMAIINSLTPNRRHRQAVNVLAATVALWTLASVFVMIFQCSASKPWNYVGGTCIDRPVWWSIYDVCNAVTELCLVILPIYFIHTVQWPWQRKAVFSVPFAVRLCTSAACIIDIALWLGKVQGSSDPFFEEWKTSVTAQAIQCCCISSVAVLYMKGFLGLVESGFGLDEDLNTTAPVELRSVFRQQSQEGLTQSASLPGYSSHSKTKSNSHSETEVK